MIKGLIAPILSPFNDDLSFNQDLYNALAAELLATGCSGLAPFGTTGEALSVSSAERMAALEGLVASGIDPRVIIPGTGLCNLPESIALSRHAVELGCAGVMTLPPFYFKGMGDDGYFDYFEKLIDGVDHPDLKIYLYHIPQVSGVGLSIDLVKRLRAAYPEIIVGIKDSSGNWENTARLLEIDGLIVYPGAELPVIDAIRLGGPGCISATANLNGTDIARVIDLCHDGKWQDAEAAHEAVKAVRLLFQDYAPIPAQKALLAKRTGDARWNNLRPPFRAIDDATRDKLAADLAPYGMMF
ncbi:MAG TPA: dihydrodipicolinate synthase family protein [Alphaproteobacteria bacterium]|nr:MAG: dihydrodipicolinate synthase family protein [SAR116 cluster bacterium MED-G06]HCV88534.1 dihydrodipicolinate synthase family protein [Alphaproteobacteria bacterium]